MTDNPARRYTQHHLTADQTLDILARHPIPRTEISVTVDHMPTDWHAHILTRILALTTTHTPTIAELDLSTDDTHRLIFLPHGRRRDLPALQTQLADLAHRRHIALELAHAAEAVNRGADPDTVLARLARGAA